MDKFDTLQEMNVYSGEQFDGVYHRVKSFGRGFFMFNGVYCPIFEDSDYETVWKYYSETLKNHSRSGTKQDYIRYIRKLKLNEIERRR